MSFKKIILIAFIILFGINFYQFHDFADFSNTNKVLGLLIILLIFIFNRQSKIYMPSKKYLNLYILGLVGSVFMSYFFWKQPIELSIFSLKSFMFIFFYYALHRLRPTLKEINYVIYVIGLGYVLIYILNYFLYPDHLFGAQASERRGTLTFNILGVIFMILTMFKSYQNILKKKALLTNFIIVFLCLLSVILRASRNSIFSVIVTLLIYQFFIGRSISKKVITLILSTFILFILWTNFNNIFINIFEKTQTDLSEGLEYVRFLSGYYYLFEHSPSVWNFIFGNGIFNGSSSYGKYFMETLWVERGFYAEDVGIIGFWSYFGFVTLIAYFGIISIFFKKYNPLFIRMFAFYLFLMSLATYDSYQPDSLILQSILLYVSDLNHNQSLVTKNLSNYKN